VGESVGEGHVGGARPKGGGRRRESVGESMIVETF
jgi:hypothetical protein